MEVYRKLLFSTLLLAASFIINAQQLIIYDKAELVMSPSTTFILNNGTSLVNNSGDNLVLSGNLVFKGSYPQSISGSKLSVSKLKLDDDAELSLQQDLEVRDELTLTDGVIILADNNLRVKKHDGMSGNFSENAMIVTEGDGKFELEITQDGEYIMPLGDNNGIREYSPAKFTLTGGNYKDAVIALKVINEKFSQNTSTTNYLNRYWESSQQGITGDFSNNVELNYLSADVNGTVSDDFIGALWDGSKWISLDKVQNNTITGSTKIFGIFTAGERKVLKLAKLDNEDILDLQIEGNKVILKSTSEFPINKIEIFNKLGQTIKSVKPANSLYYEYRFERSNDIYLIRISSDSKVITKKVFVN